MAEQAATANWKRFGPLAVIAVVAVAAFFLFRDYLSFSAFAEHYDTLTGWRDRNYAVALMVFVAIYVAAVAVSLPGAVWLTIAGGFLFGTIIGSVAVIAAATAGAVLIFLAARTALGDTLRNAAGSWLDKMEKGFQSGEVSYLLIMRLIPFVPFFVANVAPAFLGARLFTFLWTTFVGIIPGTVVYISIGSGLGEQLSRGEAPDLGVIFEWHVLGPLLGLAALSALPLLLKGRAVSGGASDE